MPNIMPDHPCCCGDCGGDWLNKIGAYVRPDGIYPHGEGGPWEDRPGVDIVCRYNGRAASVGLTIEEARNFARDILTAARQAEEG